MNFAIVGLPGALIRALQKDMHQVEVLLRVELCSQTITGFSNVKDIAEMIMIALEKGENVERGTMFSLTMLEKSP